MLKDEWITDDLPIRDPKNPQLSITVKVLLPNHVIAEGFYDESIESWYILRPGKSTYTKCDSVKGWCSL